MLQPNLINHLNDHISLFNKLEVILKDIERISDKLIEILESGNKIIIAGNGGSAGDSQHFSAELTGRFKIERKSLAAISLTTDTSAITAIGNDYTYDIVFERQLEGLAKTGDAFIGISTSGNSTNVFKAMQKANEIGCTTFALLGKDGGKVKPISNYNITVPHNSTDRIQEAHIFIIHLICEKIDYFYSNHN